ncbi:hypothetical protein V6R21_12175 [Limibacter armeniacum]|uniref:tetratricopeptide repeat protein n=1 Tax=Limibacter armeniacum TaxID=466084 RepID=UPI002FE518D4
MSLTIHTAKTKAVIIGVGEFPKDESLAPIGGIQQELDSLKSAFVDKQVLGLPKENIVSLVDKEDNTRIKEVLASAAEESKDTLIICFNGYVVLRKERLFFMTGNSTLEKAHVNGIALEEIIDILKETEAQRILFLIDAEYQKLNFESDIQPNQLVVQLFDQYGSDLPNKVFLSTPTDDNVTSGLFTKELVQILENGISKQQATITLDDIFEKFQHVSEDIKPLISKGDQGTFKLAFNKRYAKFIQLKEDADLHFVNAAYQSARPYLKEASELFPEDEEISKKKAFVELLTQAEAAYNREAFVEAHATFNKATALYQLPTSTEGSIRSLAAQANRHFEAEDFENAKILYEQLVKLDDTNNASFQERLDKSIQEIEFITLRHKGDEAYFKGNYSEAMKNYASSMKTHSDPVVVRRMEECERFIVQENIIREKVKVELEDEIRQQLQSEFNTTPQETPAKAEEGLSKETEESLRQSIRDEVMGELEDAFWKRTAIWNAEEAYDFYISVFPQGKHITKAKQRVIELRSIQPENETPAPANEVVDNEVTPTTVTNEVVEEENITEVPEVNGHETVTVNGTSIHGLDQALLSKLRHEPVEDVIKEISESLSVNGIAPNTETPVTEEVSSIAEEVVIPAIDNELQTEVQETLEAVVEETPAIEDESVVADSTQEEPVQEVEVPTEEVATPILAEEQQEEVEEAVENETSFEVNITEEISAAEELIAGILDKEEQSEKEDNVKTPSIERSQPAVTAQKKAPKRQSEVESESSDEASLKALSEDDLWKRAEQERTVLAYMDYINYTKESLHIADAYYMINKLSSQEGSSNKTATFTETTTSTPSEDTSVETTPVSNAVEENVDVTSLDEESLWQYAKSKDTVDAYREYLSHSEDNAYLTEAYSRINELNRAEDKTEEAVVEEAPVTPPSDFEEVYKAAMEKSISETTEEETTVSHFNEVEETVSESPVTDFAEPEVNTEEIVEEEVEEPVAAIEETESEDDEEDILWKNTIDEDSMSAYFNYLNLTKEKRYWDEAKGRINDLKNDSQNKEEKDWKEAEQHDTVEAYKEYIKQYPLGIYYAKAMFRINALESQLK